MKRQILNALTAAILFLMPNLNFGQAPSLGAASGFAVFTAAGQFTVTGASVVTGDVGNYTGAFSAFPPGTLYGNKHVGDGTAFNAAAAVATAYGSFPACVSTISVTLGGGQLLTPNVYCTGAASTFDGDLTLDGQNNPNALFIFEIGGAFHVGITTPVNIILIDSASLCNVYWRIAGAFDLHHASVFKGTVIAAGAIALTETATLLGRALSTAGAISLAANIVTLGLQPTPSTITPGGPTSFCQGGSVTLSGNIGGIWSNAATTPSITVTTGGDYFVTNSTECGSVTSNHILVTVHPLPTVSTISASGPTTFCPSDSVILSGNIGGIWSTGATTPFIIVKTSGDYFVTNSTEWCSVTSNHILVTVGTCYGNSCGSIPTLSEWGLIILSLLLLALGIVFIRKRQYSFALAGSADATEGRKSLFMPRLFFLIVAILFSFALLGFAGFMTLGNSLPLRDMIGALISCVILAYILQLLVSFGKK